MAQQMYGVDVSQFQGAINWDELNAVSNFVIIRAAYGTMPDTQFAHNQSEARRVQAAAGPLGIGYYYFAYPTLLDAVTSANYFVDSLGELPPGELLAMDLEGNIGPDPVAWTLAWLKQVESRTNRKPVVYLNQSEVTGNNWQPVIDNGNGLWLADYDGNKTGPGVATPWPVTAIRQWTDADTVAGISGNVDGDVFYGDINAWNAYGGLVPAPPAQAPVEPVVPVPAPSPPADVPVSVAPSSPTPPAPAEPVSEPVGVPAPVPPTTDLSDLAPEAEEIAAAVKKVDPLSKLPKPILVKIQKDEQSAASWLATGTAKTLLKLAGAAAGWYLSNPNLLHIPALGPTVIGAILAGAFADFKQK